MTYRYTLRRELAPLLPGPAVTFVMLNPSTATDEVDDPTIRRCMDFAKRWDCTSLRVVNLFAARATDPRELRHMTDPIGPENDSAIVTEAAAAGVVVLAWGVHGTYRGRDQAVWRLLRPFRTGHLGLTKGGHPRHPLYVPARQPLAMFV